MVVVGTHPAGPLKPAAPDQAPAGEAEADNEADNEAKGGKEDDPAGIILREDISSEAQEAGRESKRDRVYRFLVPTPMR